MDPKPLDKQRWSQVGLIQSSFPGSPTIGTGTLIHRLGILTAAHNIYSPTYGGWANGFKITFGNGDARDATKPNGRVIPDWVSTNLADPLSPYDLGVILLNEPVTTVPLADFSASTNTDLWGHNTNVVGYPIRPDFWNGDNHSLAGLESLPFDMGAPWDVYRLAYPTVSLPGMSGGPVYRTDELSPGMKIRAVNTSVYNGMGNGLLIYPNLALWINKWLGEVS